MIYNSDIINLKLLNELTPKELQLYLYLYWKRDYRRNIAYMSYSHIREDLKISSPNALQKYIQGLKEKGYIDIISSKKSAIATSYSYRLLVDLEDRTIANSNNSIDEFTMNNIINNYTLNTELRKVLLAYVKMRKHTKPISDDAELEILLNKLDKLASSDKDKITIIETSVINKWMDIFSLNNKNTKGKNITYEPNSNQTIETKQRRNKR